ncbi:MAG: MurR/RpiR family transcriptional regulator [Lutispora sp.]|jgi:DNA-binding MurR/RpiR family transcriptional regulator|uniref:MurR/RpiR family transcriptional regulator n=1 Tax=Lutispora sp. TaxID=2828727 RepID=UPI0035683C47
MEFEPKSGVLIIIKNIINRLPESEKKVALYILNNPEDVLNMTVAELGEKSNTSGSAVMRLCKSINVKSYQELKLRIYSDTVSNIDLDNIDIKKGDTIQSVAQSIRNNSIRSIEETYNLFDLNTLAECVNLINKAETIVITGIGASFLAAKDAQQKFLRINKNCYALEDIHLTATTIANLKKNDLVIGISASGETKEIIKLIELANSRDLETICITNHSKNTLSKVGKYCIYTPIDLESPVRSAATTSRLAQLFIIDVLFTYLATLKYDATIKNLEKTIEAINIFKKSVFD